MPITLNSFTCTNGHTFEANAKLRTRCPECGVMTKRSFIPKVELPKEEPKIEPKEEHSKIEPKEEHPKEEPPKKRPVLVRQGRPRMATKPKQPVPPAKRKIKTTIIGSKVSGGLVSKRRIKARGTMPTVKGRPIKTAVARGSVQGHEQTEVFWHKVARKYGI